VNKIQTPTTTGSETMGPEIVRINYLPLMTLVVESILC